MTKPVLLSQGDSDVTLFWTMKAHYLKAGDRISRALSLRSVKRIYYVKVYPYHE